jgi:heptosyltransferase II
MIEIISIVFLLLIFLLLIFLYYTKYSYKTNRVIIRLPNHIGDTLMTYPLLLGLQKSNIDFICIGHEWCLDLFSGTNIKLIVSKDIKYYSFYKLLYTLNPKYCILCTNNLSTLIPSKLISSVTIGNSYLCDRSIKKTGHQVQTYFDLGKHFIDSSIHLNNLTDKIPLSITSIRKGKIILSKLDTEFIVICPYATNLHKKKNKEWPYWKEFCRIFTKYQIIILVSKNDYIRCQQDFPNNVIFSEDLGTTAYIMTRAKYVFANDSGAMHLASFFGANVIGLFGATEINKTRPWYGRYIIGNNGSFPEINEVIDRI